jgi:hypothetical protein
MTTKKLLKKSKKVIKKSKNPRGDNNSTLVQMKKSNWNRFLTFNPYASKKSDGTYDERFVYDYKNREKLEVYMGNYVDDNKDNNYSIIWDINPPSISYEKHD